MPYWSSTTVRRATTCIRALSTYSLNFQFISCQARPVQQHLLKNVPSGCVSLCFVCWRYTLNSGRQLDFASFYPIFCSAPLLNKMFECRLFSLIVVKGNVTRSSTWIKIKAGTQFWEFVLVHNQQQVSRLVMWSPFFLRLAKPNCFV